MQEQARAAMSAAKKGSLLPERYADYDTSGLLFDVVEGDNVFEIKLAD